MASELNKIWEDGEIDEIFPYGTEGDQEALVTYRNKLYHIHLSETGQPIAILGMQGDGDYDDDLDDSISGKQEGYGTELSDFWLHWVDEEDEIDPSMLDGMDEEE